MISNLSDRELYQLARASGLNISAITRRALIVRLEQLKDIEKREDSGDSVLRVIEI